MNYSIVECSNLLAISSFPKPTNKDGMIISTLCGLALKNDRKSWDTDGRSKKFVSDAQQRNLTIDDCREAIGLNRLNTPTVPFNAAKQNMIKVKSDVAFTLLAQCGPNIGTDQFDRLEGKLINGRISKIFQINGGKFGTQDVDLQMRVTSTRIKIFGTVKEPGNNRQFNIESSIKPEQKKLQLKGDLIKENGELHASCNADLEFSEPPLDLVPALAQDEKADDPTAPMSLNDDKNSDQAIGKICKTALDVSKLSWADRTSSNSTNLKELERRGITIDMCRVSLGLPTIAQALILAEKKADDVKKSAADITAKPDVASLNQVNKAIKDQTDAEICNLAMDTARQSWSDETTNANSYVNEARRRSLSILGCRTILGLPSWGEVLKQEAQQQNQKKAEEQKLEATRKELLGELVDFVRTSSPSTDHIEFSIAISNFKTALSKTDEQEKAKTFKILIDILEIDQNYQDYKRARSEKQRQAEVTKLNFEILKIKLAAEFISDTLRRDPFNENAALLGLAYRDMSSYVDQKEYSKIDDYIKQFLTQFDQLKLKQAYLKFFTKSANTSFDSAISVGATTALPATNEAAAVENLQISPNLSSSPKILANNDNNISKKNEKRSALIIGNSEYQYVSRLDNPKKDTALIAENLITLGFDNVIQKTDVTRESLIKALQEFAIVADGSDWSMIYYAGHGIEFGGTNYLIPVDARLKADRDIDLEAVNLGQLFRSIDGSKKLKMVILDACRDNPFAAKMKRTVASRSVGRGLASIEPEAGTLVVYAAKNGEIAYDGEGENSPFATAFVRRLTQKPALEVRRLFDFVRDDVLETTSKKQQPFSYGSLPANEDYYFGD